MTGEHCPRIAVLVDPDRPAGPAVEVAATLASAFGGSLDLVSVVMVSASARTVDGALRVEADRHPGLPVSTTRLDGPVAAAIVGHLALTRPDLVVLDSHGRSPLAGRALGHVSADVVRDSPVPTLLVGPRSRLGTVPDRLLVGLDGSQAADDAALSVADVLAERLGLGLELLSVVVPGAASPGAEAGVVATAAASFEPPLRRWDVLHDAAPATALLERSAEPGGAILVLGNAGGERARSLGSVAAPVVHRAEVPVLVVGPAAAAEIRDRPGRRRLRSLH